MKVVEFEGGWYSNQLVISGLQILRYFFRIEH